jgi:hypothetical protein
VVSGAEICYRMTRGIAVEEQTFEPLAVPMIGTIFFFLDSYL